MNYQASGHPWLTAFTLHRLVSTSVSLASVLALGPACLFGAVTNTVVVPGTAVTNREVYGSSTLRGADARVQQVYASSLFPTGAMIITELRFRPDPVHGRPFASTVANIQISLSSTLASAEGLSTEFQSNVGSGAAVVLNGAVTLSSAATGPVGGPRDFDIRLPFTTPFLYSPGYGNLLVDIRNASGSTATFLGGQAAAGDGGARVVGGLDSATGSADTGADAIEIVYVPTHAPAAWPATNVVVPNLLANLDGIFGSGTLNNAGVRVQQAYHSNQFPARALLVHEIRFRPDYHFGYAFTSTLANIQVSLSTQPNRAPESLSGLFAANVGADDLVVFSGPLSIASRFQGPPLGPKAFDIVIPFSVPFLYVPRDGHLLVDIRNFSGSTACPLAGHPLPYDGAGRVFGPVNGSSGAFDFGADAIQLIYQPVAEPPPVPPPPPPENDAFTNRVSIAGLASSLTLNNAPASAELGEPTLDGCSTARKTLWYEYRAATAGRLRLGLSRLDGGPAIIGLFQGESLDALQALGVSCDGAINLPVNSGDRLPFVIDSGQEGSGTLLLETEFSPAPPTMHSPTESPCMERTRLRSATIAGRAGRRANPRAAVPRSGIHGPVQ